MTNKAYKKIMEPDSDLRGVEAGTITLAMLDYVVDSISEFVGTKEVGNPHAALTEFLERWHNANKTK